MAAVRSSRIIANYYQPLSKALCARNIESMEKRIVRKIYSHNHHLSSVDYFLSESQDNDKSEIINSTACLVFAAFTIEAFLNHIGEQVFPCWKKYIKKSLQPEAKLILIAEKIGLSVKFGEDPFQTFRTLFRFRNLMAHSITEELEAEKAKHFLQVGDEYWPATEWEKMCNSNTAQRVSDDIDRIIRLIEEKSGVEHIPEFLLSEFSEV